MVLFAFSIQDQVEKYGAYVGLAAFLGLAVLTVLYFAQARELKRLRDWAGRAPERAQELEARVVANADEARRTQVAEPSGTVGPAQPAPAVAQTAGNGRPTPQPATIPIGPRPAVAVAAAAAALASAPAVAAPAPAETETGGEEDEAATDGRPPEETQLHDTLGGDDAAPAEEKPAEDEAPKSDPSGNGTGEHPVIPRATPRPQPQQPKPSPEPAAAPLRATPAASKAAPAAPRRSRRPSLGGTSSAARITALTLTGVVVLAAIVFAITQLFSGGSSPKPAPNVTQPPQSSAKAGSPSAGPTAAQARPNTVVAILNGTPTEGLASGARDKLISKGYSNTDGMIRTGNNTDQQRQDSAVFFAPGKRRQARDVATILGVSAPPQAVDPDTLALANATGTGGKSADVVAVLGLDQSP